jgi:hypothetical protein
MHTTCFDQHLSSSGVSEIADETLVLPFLSSILWGYALIYVTHDTIGGTPFTTGHMGAQTRAYPKKINLGTKAQKRSLFIVRTM